MRRRVAQQASDRRPRAVRRVRHRLLQTASGRRLEAHDVVVGEGGEPGSLLLPGRPQRCVDLQSRIRRRQSDRACWVGAPETAAARRFGLRAGALPREASQPAPGPPPTNPRLRRSTASRTAPRGRSTICGERCQWGCATQQAVQFARLVVGPGLRGCEEASSRALPKSASFSLPSRVTSRLDGLISCGRALHERSSLRARRWQATRPVQNSALVARVHRRQQVLKQRPNRRLAEPLRAEELPRRVTRGSATRCCAALAPAPGPSPPTRAATRGALSLATRPAAARNARSRRGAREAKPRG
jgi:hypothetical protein